MAQQNQNAQDTPLWEEDEIERDKWSSALLGFVNEPGAAGRTRKGAIALLQEMLQEVNPLVTTWESEILYERPHVGMTSNIVLNDTSFPPNQASLENVDFSNFTEIYRNSNTNRDGIFFKDDRITLDFVSGSSGPRHSFDESYEFFEFFGGEVTGGTNYELLLSDTYRSEVKNTILAKNEPILTNILETNGETPLYIKKGSANSLLLGTICSVTFNTQSSQYRYNAGQTRKFTITKIVGWKKTLSPRDTTM